nr:MAG TPA: hypothetical protein [Herelleviridae sp.]
MCLDVVICKYSDSCFQHNTIVRCVHFLFQSGDNSRPWSIREVSASSTISYPWPSCPSAANGHSRLAWFSAYVLPVECPSTVAQSYSSCRSSTES